MAKGSEDIILGLKVVAGIYLLSQVSKLLSGWNRGEVINYDCTGVRSFSPSYYTQAAIDLEVLFYEDITEDEDGIIAILEKLPKDSDICELIRVYGLRGPVYAANISLPLAVNRYLSKSDVAEINEAYALKGIQYRFY